MKDQFDEIELDDLTSDLMIVAKYCGLDAVRNMLRELQGMSFYIPRISRLDRFISRFINNNKHKTRKEIAKHLRVTEQFLKKFI